MGDVLKVWDEGNSIWIPIPAIQGAQGPQGPKGDKGDTGDFSPLDAYPVGAFYISAVQTSPAELFGGNWERITGQFLLGTDTTENNPGTYSAGSTGGEAEHTLSVEEMPQHKHSYGLESNHIVGLYKNGYVGRARVTRPSTGNYYTFQSNSTGVDDIVWGGSTTQGKGSGTAHNNMPPYLAVYIWQRVS